jgi:hypothetical protein
LALAAGIGKGLDLAIRRLSDAPAERVLGWHGAPIHRARPTSERSPVISRRHVKRC